MNNTDNTDSIKEEEQLCLGECEENYPINLLCNYCQKCEECCSKEIHPVKCDFCYILKEQKDFYSYSYNSENICKDCYNNEEDKEHEEHEDEDEEDEDDEEEKKKVCEDCKNSEYKPLECDNCKTQGCNTCIETVCCDCCVTFCNTCKEDYDTRCGCYGSCSSCNKDVDRGEDGWPCYKCGDWLCVSCKKNEDNTYGCDKCKYKEYDEEDEEDEDNSSN